MNIKVKKSILREIVVLVIFVLITLVSNLIYFSFHVGTDRLNEYLEHTVEFMQLIPVFTFFYPIYIMVRINLRKPQGIRHLFVFVGFIALVSGILSFLWAIFMYVCANMDFAGFIHYFIAFLSPILIVIGIVSIIIGTIKIILSKKENVKFQN